MDVEDITIVNADNHGAEDSTGAPPLSPELSTKKRRRKRKSVYVSLPGSNSDSTSEVSSKVSQEIFGTEGSYIASTNNHAEQDGKNTTNPPQTNVVATTAIQNELFQTLDIDVNLELIGSQNKTLTTDIDCSNIDTTLKVDHDEGTQDLVKSPVLKSHSHRKLARRLKRRKILDDKEGNDGSSNATRPGSSHSRQTDSGSSHQTDPVSSLHPHQTNPGSSHQTKPGSSHQTKPGSSHQTKPGSSHQTKPGSSHQTKPGSSHQTKPGASRMDPQLHENSSGSSLLPNEYCDLSFSLLEEICQKTEMSFNRDTKSNICSDSEPSSGKQCSEISEKVDCNDGRSSSALRKAKSLTIGNKTNDINGKSSSALLGKQSTKLTKKIDCNDSQPASVLSKGKSLKNGNKTSDINGKSSSERPSKLENKKIICDKLVIVDRNLNKNGNKTGNCNETGKSIFVVDIGKECDKKFGSIYVNNSNKKPTVNPCSIKTLLESAKLLDEAESVSSVEETKKQKEFKLVCRKEKLNDGSYVCFESIVRGNRVNGNIPREKNLRFGRNESCVTPSRLDKGTKSRNENKTLCNEPSLMVKDRSSRYENKALCDKPSLMDEDGNSSFEKKMLCNKPSLVKKYENKALCDKSSLMEKYDIDMNNTLNLSTQQWDVLISSAEKPKCDKTTTPNVSTNSECFKIFDEKQVVPINDNCENFEGLCKRQKRSVEPENNPCRTTNFQEIQCNKSKSFKKPTINANNPLKSSCTRFNSDGNGAKNGEEMLSKVVGKSVEKNCVEENSPTFNKETSTEKAIDTKIGMNCDKLNKTSKNSSISERTDLIPTTVKPNLELVAGGNTFKEFSTASGKTISVSEKALINARKLLSEYENNNTALSGFSTANGKSITVSEKALSKAKIFLTENECCDSEFSCLSFAKHEATPVSRDVKCKEKLLSTKIPAFSGFSTASGQSISVSDEALAEARTLLQEKEEFETDEFESFSTINEKPTKAYEEVLNKDSKFLPETKISEFSNCSTKKDKSIGVLKTAENSFISEKDDTVCDKSTGFSTGKGKPIKVSDEALMKARKFLSENETCDEGINDLSTANFELFSVPDKTSVQAKIPLQVKEHQSNGFSTAKGKTIKISEEALEKAKTMLYEKENCDTVSNGFSTAKGKSISVSKEALARAKAFLQENESGDQKFPNFKSNTVEETGEEFIRTKTTLSEKHSVDSKFLGFSTARGKQIKVSEEALEKARALLTENETCDLDLNGVSKTAKTNPITNLNETSSREKMEESLDENKFCGFSTAKGKPIKVSEEALVKARTFLAENDFFDTAASDASINIQQPSSDCKFSVFSTAKGKSIEVSEESLVKARNLLSELESSNTGFNGFSTAKGKSIEMSEESLLKARKLLSEQESSNVGFSGFSTAKGKSIEVSEESLVKARRVLCDEEPCNTAFSGFSTAKGKTIEVSEEALAKARTLLSENESFDGRLIGFSTAKGKPIEVSKEALDKARTLLSDKETSITNSNSNEKSIPVSNVVQTKARKLFQEKKSNVDKFCGFSTATGKSIKVSEEALSKARSLLAEKETEFDCKGFTTAGGKSIKVSQDALLKAKSLLSETDCDAGFSGFSTAQGKTIQVSEAALLKARNLFTENEPDTCVLDGVTSLEESLKKAPEKAGKLLHGSEINSNMLHESANNSSKLPRYQISVMNEDDSSNFSHDSELVDVCNRLDTIEEESVLQDSSIDEHSQPQSLPDKNTKSPNVQSQFYEDMPCLSLSFVDEVSESTAAFLADEDVSEAPVWLKPFVTSPSFIEDRPGALSPIICTSTEAKLRKKRACSPILGSGDRFKKRKKRLTFSKKLDDVECSSSSTPKTNLAKKPEDAYSNFAGNLRTSTPISTNRTRLKRAIPLEETNCVSEKKQKLMDSWDDSQVDQTIFYQLDVIEGRRKAAEKQELLLKNGKDKSLIKMRKGDLFVKKQQSNNRISLRSVIKFPNCKLTEIIERGVKQSVIDVTYSNAVDFRFSASNSLPKDICETNCDGVLSGDNALVILNDGSSAGLKEIGRAFQASPSVDPTLISHEWIANHYRLIVWKLASLERSVPHLLAGNCLTLDNVLYQLKYRYDREIDDCERSCLRKILETDESAARRMVLCVGEIILNRTTNTKEVRLTDGWYSIKASLDEEMLCLIERGKVKVGTKLVVQGCELLNCEQGYDPLQVPDSVQIKLHTNSTRRAKWDTRLGFCQIQGPVLVSKLKDILPKGGNVGKINVLVVRVYPLVYMFKTETGKTVVYSKKREEQECLMNERRMTELLERLQSQVQKEMDEIEREESLKVGRREYDEGMSTQDMVETDRMPTRDQMRIMSNIREQKQRKYQETLRQKLDEKMSENGTGKRNSIPMLKVKVIDPRPENGDNNSTLLQTAMLTVWKPTEDVENVLVEGNIVSLYNVTAQGKRSGELQLSTGRQTKYSVGSKSEAFTRVCHFLSDITRSLNPIFSEINTVGLVVHVESSSTSVETAYITDHENNFLGIRFWGNIKKYGWQSCVCVGSEISCSNLEWRSNAYKFNVPHVFATELSVFSSNPRSKYLQNALHQFKTSLKGMDLSEFLSKSKEKLLDLLNGGETSGTILNSSSRMYSPAAAGQSTPSASNKSLITESTMSSVKSKVLLEKMQKLHGYGTPPTITALPSLQVSPALKKDFKTPSRQS